MKRISLALALIAVAGTASVQPLFAQTLPVPPNVNVPPIADTSSIKTEADARAAIERDGYKSISNLRMGADGKWSGSAMRDNQQIAVSVDATGKVSSQ
jgi:hypothetical protein